MNRWVVAVVMQAGPGSFYSWSVFREPLSSLYGALMLVGATIPLVLRPP